MQPVNQRQGFLVSAILHLTILMILVSHPPDWKRRDEPDVTQYERKDIVFMPPKAVLRQLAPKPMPVRPVPPAAPPQTVPTLPPPPPDAAKKDRISVGSAFDKKSQVIDLQRDRDITAAPKGAPSPPPTAAPLAPPSTAPSGPPAVAANGSKAVPGSPGLRLPPGLTGRDLPSGEEGSPARRGPIGQSMASAINRLEQRLERDAQLGLPTGAGQNIGGVFFDRQGADFTAWLNRFKNEAYRNWIVPPAAMGFGGTAEFEFTVERDGSLSALRMLKSTGMPALDRAVQNALANSQFVPLPSDYGPPRVTMRVVASYILERSGS